MNRPIREVHALYTKETGRNISFSQLKKLRPIRCLTVDKKFAHCLCDVCINVEFTLMALKDLSRRQNKQASQYVLSKYASSDASLCNPTKDCVHRACTSCGVHQLKNHITAAYKDQLGKEIQWQRWQLVTIASYNYTHNSILFMSCLP